MIFQGVKALRQERKRYMKEKAKGVAVTAIWDSLVSPSEFGSLRAPDFS